MSDYAQQAKQYPQSPKTSSLIDDGGKCLSKLETVLSRLGGISDRLYGSIPRDAGSPATGVPEQATMRRAVDRMAALIESCEAELNRIENQL